MGEFTDLLDATYFGNTVWQWVLAGGIALVTFSVLLTLRRIVRSQYASMEATPKVELLELPFKVASRTTTFFIFIVPLTAAAQALVLPDKLTTLIVTIFTIAAFWQAGLWATTAILASLERRAKREMEVNRAAVGTLGIIGFIARMTIWSFVLLLTLDNLGIQIQPLLAGLGIGGIAVALAVQNVLGDLLASLAITLDRPFVIGDSLAIDDFSGTVEYIGVKSTRLRSVSGEQIILSNSNLMSSRMRNHSRLRERRVVFTISLSQDTPHAKLERVPAVIRSLIEEHKDIRFDRSHFSKISANSFDIETVYFVTTPNYGRYMDIQQQVYLGLLDALSRDGISLAQPLQTLRMERSADIVSELVDGKAQSAALVAASPKNTPSS